jgi:hypothetical protein
MQNRYVGDVGDFGKYGLLRALCNCDFTKIRLGIVWYLVPSESHNDDGKHVNYLRTSAGMSTSSLRRCDPKLHDGLKRLLVNDQNEIMSERRLVTTVESSGLLPLDTVFYSAPLSYSREMSTSKRLEERRSWLKGALQATVSADLVFLDPDNGIECKSVSRTQLKGPKYVFWDEIGAFVNRGQSVVVYHHLNRLGSSVQQVEHLQTEFSERMPPNSTTQKIIYTRGTRRAYFVVATGQHRTGLANQLSNMLTQWENQFVNS